MGRPRLTDSQPGFAGGLNLSGDESQVQPTELRRAENARLTEFGGASKRLGTKRILAAALESGAAIQNVFFWRKETSTELTVVVNGKLYAGAYAIPATLTNKTGTLATTGNPWITPFRVLAGERLYILDGGPLNVYDGTTLTTDLASTPDATVGCVYNQRLYGITGVDALVYYSDLNDGDSLGIPGSGGGFARVVTFGDQRLTGLGTLGASLFLFHVSGISRFTGLTQDDIAIQAGAQGVTGEVGTISPFSIVGIQGLLLFCGSSAGGLGFYRLAESGPPERISVKIDRSLRTLTATQIAGIRSGHSPLTSEVWWTVPTLGVYVYNYALQQWSGPWNAGWLSPETTALCGALDTNGREIVLRGDASGYISLCDAASVYRDNVLSDGTGGTTFTMYLRCHRFFSGQTMVEKSLRWGYVLGNPRGSEAVTIRWATPSNSGTYALTTGGGSSWGSGTWGAGTWGGSNVFSFRVPMSGRGVWCDFTIEDGGESEAIYSQVDLEGFDMGRRG